MRHIVLTLLACLIGMAAPAARGALAQEAPDLTAFETERDGEYDAATRFRRIQSDLVYVDRLNGQIPLDGGPDPQLPDTEDRQTDRGLVDNITWVNRGLLLVMLVFAGFVLWRQRAAILGRFGRVGDAQRRSRDADASDTGADHPVPTDAGFLDRITAMADREAALIMLVAGLLSIAARRNGLRLARSETARDLLRRLPREWPHLQDLRRIVMTEELVQFGGRPLSERSFSDCIERARPILAASTAPNGQRAA